ncbi:uncharacterized protein LOC141685655 [Apium graveolens]|uniref:uncharacterized protein LOC141685655 n=1 Tax=Apium graveolens TaxID=4045 RepID=UPI003D79073B
MCPVCISDEETTIHALVTCPKAAHIWSLIIPDINQQVEEDFFEWMDRVLSQVDKERRALIVTVSWAIWRVRNEKVWRNKNCSANGVLYSAKSYLTQWRETQSRSFVTLPHAGQADDGAFTWVKSQESLVKVNVDAALFPEQLLFGAGMVIRDCRGDLIQAKTVLSAGVMQPELAEVMAIKEALSWMEVNGWHEGILESDCLEGLANCEVASYGQFEKQRENMLLVDHSHTSEKVNSLNTMAPFGSAVENCCAVKKVLSRKLDDCLG